MFDLFQGSRTRALWQTVDLILLQPILLAFCSWSNAARSRIDTFILYWDHVHRWECLTKGFASVPGWAISGILFNGLTLRSDLHGPSRMKSLLSPFWSSSFFPQTWFQPLKRWKALKTRVNSGISFSQVQWASMKLISWRTWGRAWWRASAAGWICYLLLSLKPIVAMSSVLLSYLMVYD